MPYLHEEAVAYAPHLTIPPDHPEIAEILYPVVTEVLSIYRDTLAQASKGRQRAPAIKPPARLAATALVANAARCVWEGFPAFYLSRGRKGLESSTHPADNRSRDRILAALEDHPSAPLKVIPGSRTQGTPTATTVLLRADVAASLLEIGPASELLFDAQGPSAIIDRVDLREAGRSVAPKAEQLDELDRLRGGVRRLNTAIAAGHYAYRGRPRTPSPLYRVMAPDLKGRGRWFGGWWQGLSKRNRADNLEIDRERVVEVDFTASALSIAYGLAQQRMPEGDPYALDGLTDQAARAGVKNFVCAMLSSKKPLKAWPGATYAKNGNRIPSDAEAYLQGRITPSALARLITEKHSAVSSFLSSGRMDAIQRVESNAIALSVMKLREADISALPVHDALWVAESQAERTCDVMASALASCLGIPSVATLGLPAPAIGNLP
ncbi:hypothetical protein [Maricaulis salignorans]|uniref:hypothetical protein n=1 Tax=Maricaulis salignorans TaxID=144026 RepID=UPI003A94D22B